MSGGSIVITEEMMRRAVAAFRLWEDEQIDRGDMASIIQIPAPMISEVVGALFGGKAVFDQKALEVTDFPNEVVSNGVT